MSRLSFLPTRMQPAAGRAASRVYNAARTMKGVVRPNFGSPAVEWTCLVDPIDETPQSLELMELAIAAGRRARDVCFDEFDQRHPGAARRANVWPGEHYRFLAGLAAEVEPTLVVEVGTATGASALAISAGLSQRRLVTYDLVPWQDYPGTLLRSADFGDGLEQRLGNLVEPDFLSANLDVLKEADLLFIDGPKDGRFEPTLHAHLVECCKPGALLVYDDIRLHNMVKFWATLTLPRFDATSLAHFTGTGLVSLQTIQERGEHSCAESSKASISAAQRARTAAGSPFERW